MLSDIFEHAIQNEPGWELMRDTEPIEPPGLQPDLVIVGTSHPGDDDGAPALLARWPSSRVLLITDNGQSASLVELQPRRTELGEVSLSELLLAIRLAVHQPSPSPLAFGQLRSTGREH
jgi:hypothetical protein